MTSQIEVGFRIYSTVVKAEHLGSRDVLFYENRSLESYAINEIIQKKSDLDNGSQINIIAAGIDKSVVCRPIGPGTLENDALEVRKKRNYPEKYTSH